MEPRATRIGLRIASAHVIAFLWLPLLVIVVYAFNESRIPSWPVTDFSTRWFREAWGDEAARDALVLSLEVAVGATAIALVLGSAAAFAVQRFRFFGRETVSFLLVLPIALPGIVTGMALLSAIGYFDLRASTLT